MPDINESLAEFGLSIDVWPLERFKVYDRNPRAHPGGYKHIIYNPLEAAGWERVDFTVTCFAVGRTPVSGLQGAGHVSAHQAREESIYISPSVRNRLLEKKMRLAAKPALTNQMVSR